MGRRIVQWLVLVGAPLTFCLVWLVALGVVAESAATTILGAAILLGAVLAFIQAWLHPASRAGSAPRRLDRPDYHPARNSPGTGNPLRPEAADVIDSDERLKAEWVAVNGDIQNIYRVLGPPPMRVRAFVRELR
jgi:hypothetical protein